MTGFIILAPDRVKNILPQKNEQNDANDDYVLVQLIFPRTF